MCRQNSNVFKHVFVSTYLNSSGTFFLTYEILGGKKMGPDWSEICWHVKFGLKPFNGTIQGPSDCMNWERGEAKEGGRKKGRILKRRLSMI